MYCQFLPTRSGSAETLFKVASALTAPACKTRELYYRIKWIDTLDPSATSVARFADSFWLFVQVGACALGAAIVTLPGIVLRALAVRLSEHPFTYKRGNQNESPLVNNTFTMLSWNVCCVPGGYSLTDGGVAPWPLRMPRIIEAINESNADVVCLYEIMDYHAALGLFEGLKDTYAHFYFNIGAQGYGPNSGLFVASKLPVTDPHFVRFPANQLIGRTKYAAKGFFSFGTTHARIFTTHLQHSEIPARPTRQEKTARALEMNQISIQMNRAEIPALLTGDLNLDSEEYQTSNWKGYFEFGKHFDAPKTWRGDTWCARLMGKEASPPRNLDYTIAYRGRIESIRTEQLPTNYNQNAYNVAALSDHNGLLSRVRLRSSHGN